MPRCEGRPEGPCPEGRNDNSVHGTQGDLMLCHACDEYRFPTTRNDTRSAKTSKQSAAVITRAEKKAGHTVSVSEPDTGSSSANGADGDDGADGDEYRFPTTRNDTRSAKTSKQSAAVITRAEKKAGHTVSVLEPDTGSSSANGADVRAAMEQSSSTADVELTTHVELQHLSQSSDQLMHSAGMGHQGQVILNNILCFVKNKYDNYPAAVIKSTILEFYRDDEILDAKQTLVHSVSDKLLSSAIQPFVKRRVGDNKSKSSVDDIMHIWEVIDDKNAVDRLPVFCTSDTSRIATIPDELTDLSYVRKIIVELRQQVHDLTNVVMQLSSQQDKPCCCRDVMFRNDCVSAVNCQMPPAAAKVPYCDGIDVSSGQSSDQPSYTSPVLNTASVSDAYSAAPTMDMSADGNDQYSLGVNNSDNGQLMSNYSDAVKTCPPVVQDTEGTATGFKTVANKKKRRQPVIGNRCTSDLQFQGVAKKYVFCLNRLQPDTSVETVSTFLESHGISVMSCYAINKSSRSGENTVPRFISMRICVSQLDVKKIYDPDLWPAGVTVRPWSFKQRAS